MSTASIINFIKINERIASGGQPTSQQLEAAHAEGYEAVVNLAPSNADNHALPDEPAIVGSLGMEYHHIPVEWTNPKREQFLAFTEVMEGLRNKKVLIHCAANFRVTAFFSLYAMKHEGWTAEQADQLIARIWESRPDYRMDETWKSFISAIRTQLGFNARKVP
jgi:protein tyrosine phosphatase (PTP) superfamily phosphohydrolase (DUF442 family)